MNLLAVNVFVGCISAYQLKRKWECVRIASARVHIIPSLILFTFLFAVMRTPNSSRLVRASTHSHELVVVRRQRTQLRARAAKHLIGTSICSVVH